MDQNGHFLIKVKLGQPANTYVSKSFYFTANWCIRYGYNTYILDTCFIRSTHLTLRLSQACANPFDALEN